MTRNGGYNMLVRHYDSIVSIESVLASDIHCATQRAMDSGCKLEDIIRRLDVEKDMLMAEKDMLMVSNNMGGPVNQQMSQDPLHQTDSDNLDGAIRLNGQQQTFDGEALLGALDEDESFDILRCQLGLFPVPTPALIIPPAPASAHTPAPVPPLDHTPALPKAAKVPAAVLPPPLSPAQPSVPPPPAPISPSVPETVAPTPAPVPPLHLTPALPKAAKLPATLPP